MSGIMQAAGSPQGAFNLNSTANQQYGFWPESTVGKPGSAGTVFNNIPQNTSPNLVNNYNMAKNPSPGWVNNQGVFQSGPKPITGSPQASNVLGGVPGGSAGSGTYSIDSLIADSIKSRDDAKKKQEDLWNKLYGQVNAIPGKYAADPLVTGANKLTSDFLSNPEALNDETMAKIQGQNAARLRAGVDAQTRQGVGQAAASGLTDPSSMSALSERINRGASAEQMNSDTNLQVQRAQNRNQDWMNAIAAARGGAAANIAPSLSVGNMLLSNQPQFAGNDNGGLLGILMGLHGQQKADELQKQLDAEKQKQQQSQYAYAMPSLYN